MLSIIYPYRERDLDRIRFSINSLSKQTNKLFQVYFVDYGSSTKHANQIEEFLNHFDFVNYTYHYTALQPWNKSKALNSVIKRLDSDYFFVADIDMIFHPNFVEIAHNLTKTNQVWYFKVGFLDEVESSKEKEFDQFQIHFESNKEATGLTLCPTSHAKSINGFDELYHFWGSEDTDFHVRLTNAGHQVNYYDKDIVMLHKWHKTYRNKETSQLTKKLQVEGIVQFNQLHLNRAMNDNVTLVNLEAWGETISEEDFSFLQNKADLQTVYNSITEVNYFLFQRLANLKQGCYHFQFKEIEKKEQIKLQLKKVLKPKKKIQPYLSLKEVNDMVLYHIVNYYRNCSYNYEVSNDFKSIYLSIKIN